MLAWHSLHALLAVVLATCAPDGTPPQVGSPAPVFEAQDDTGKLWKSSDYVGKQAIVIYFYPADMTGGCTKQACGFRDDAAKLAEKGVLVVGVSGDTVENHQLFKKVHQLNFPLLADFDGKVAKQFGVPLKPGGKVPTKDANGKQIMLERGVTAARWTFVIDKSGKIAHINTKVNAAQDSKAILEILDKLGS